MKALNLILTLSFFVNFSNLLAQKVSQEDMYNQILDKATNNIENNYDEDIWVKTNYREIVKDTLDNTLSVENVNGMSYLRGLYTDQSEFLLEPNTSYHYNPSKAETYYMSYSHTALSGNGYIQPNIVQLRFYLLKTGNKLPVVPSICVTAGYESKTISQSYQVKDTLFNNIPSYFLEQKEELHFSFPKEKMSSAKVKFNGWEDHRIHTHKRFIIRKDDFGFLFYDKRQDILDTNGHFSFSTYHRDVFDKGKNGKYYLKENRDIIPRYENGSSCGFNKAKLYSFIIKKNTVIEETEYNKLKPFYIKYSNKPFLLLFKEAKELPKEETYDILEFNRKTPQN